MKEESIMSQDKKTKKFRLIIDPRDEEWDLGAFLYNLVAILIILSGSAFAIYFITVVWGFVQHHPH